jgi:hypothetical protein
MCSRLSELMNTDRKSFVHILTLPSHTTASPLRDKIFTLILRTSIIKTEYELLTHSLFPESLEEQIYDSFKRTADQCLLSFIL